MIAFVVSALRSSGDMLFPRLPLWGAYTRNDFRADIIAGASVAAVLIPQSIAYALLAGLPPAHGLYAALVGGIGGALWGGSRYLATGPIAIASLLTAGAIAPLALPGSPSYIALVAGLALFVGLIQVVSGLARFGFLVRLVPLSVLVGFSSAAAFVIIITQVPHFLGIPISSGAYALEQLLHVIRNSAALNLSTVIIGSAALALLFFFRVLNPKLPGTVIVIVAGVAASYVIDFQALGVAVAGAIPARLPITDIPSVSMAQLLSLSGHAFVIALVGFMSAYATVKEFSQRTREKMNPDQELVGQGFANILAGLFRGYPVGGSLSRTAVNYDAGAKTAWSGVFASFIIVGVILFSTALLAKLPTAVLAAVLVFAVLPLIDFKEMRRMYEITHTDGVISFVTFGAVFVFRLDQAVLLGVILALVLYMRKVMWVHVAEVGFHPEWRSLVPCMLFSNAITYPRLLMLRIDAPIFYANVERLEEEIEKRFEEYFTRTQHVPKVIALDFSGVNHMDVTGVEGFAELVQTLHEKRVQVYVITPRREIREIIERGNVGSQVRFVHGTRELRLIGEAFLQGKALV